VFYAGNDRQNSDRKNIYKYHKLFNLYVVYLLVKKGVYILFALVILLSGTHFSIATHYCGGRIAATKVSLSGKPVSCGMENSDHSCPLSGTHFDTSCCEDHLTTIEIINNFTQPGTIIPGESQLLVQNFYYQGYHSFHSTSNSTISYINTGPPGSLLASSVRLDYICVFQI